MTRKSVDERVPDNGASGDAPSAGRRRLLTMLGLAATAAYVAPTLLSMDKAHASGASWGRSGGRRSGGRRSGGRGSGRSTSRRWGT